MGREISLFASTPKVWSLQEDVPSPPDSYCCFRTGFLTLTVDVKNLNSGAGLDPVRGQSWQACVCAGCPRELPAFLRCSMAGQDMVCLSEVAAVQASRDFENSAAEFMSISRRPFVLYLLLSVNPLSRLIVIFLPARKGAISDILGNQNRGVVEG